MAVCDHRSVFPVVCQQRSWPPLVSKRQRRHQRRHPPRPRRWIPTDRHRRLRVLRRGDRSLLWVSVRLWSGAQDAAERSCRPGRAAHEDRHDESAEGRTVGVGGFRVPEHVVRRASQPHDSSWVGVLTPALALPRPWRQPAPRARRTLALLLQFHPAAQRVEVRARPVFVRAVANSVWRSCSSSRVWRATVCSRSCSRTTRACSDAGNGVPSHWRSVGRVSRNLRPTFRSTPWVNNKAWIRVRWARRSSFNTSRSRCSWRASSSATPGPGRRSTPVPGDGGESAASPA